MNTLRKERVMKKIVDVFRYDDDDDDHIDLNSIFAEEKEKILGFF